MRPLRSPRSPATLIVACALLAALGSTPVAARGLTFEERVAAQEAIERVYYSHQIGATKPFEEAIPRGVLERKVETYLKQSIVLETVWKTSVSAAMLQAELERIVKNTQLTGRLQHLFDVLGNDPTVIAECLARPVLVDRLTRNFFAFDREMHAATRSEAARLHRDLADGEIDFRAAGPRRTVVELRRVVAGDARRVQDRPWDVHADGESRPLYLDNEAFTRMRRTAPETVEEVGPVVELRDRFSITVVLADSADASMLATYTVRKKAWADWWDQIQGALDESLVGEDSLPTDPAGRVAAPLQRSVLAHWDPPRWIEGESLRAPGTSAGACVLADIWDNGSLDEPVFPQARYGHTAVWTGSVMVIWGGYDGFYEDPGARYDPLTDTWTPVSTIGAPSGRVSHTAVWTGSLMVVWGGSSRGSQLYEGGRYDPVTDIWMAVSPFNAPGAREGHTAVWTGRLMVVWGGFGMYSGYQNTGGRYDPVTDTWSVTSSLNAPVKRASHAAVWTGSRMIVWGGTQGPGLDQNTGGQYDPVTDAWTPTATFHAPSRRTAHTAVWTGSVMIVWGGDQGSQGSRANSGGRYDPATDSWQPTSTAGAPSRRASHTAIWTGDVMVVWGGGDGNIANSGGRYDPATDSWSATSTMAAPVARRYHSAVWTGSLMVVWGGDDGGYTNTGGRYDPATDTWTPTSTNGVAFARGGHVAVWTGTMMIVWGGSAEGHTNTGDRYDPLTDTWTPTSTIGAPYWPTTNAVVWTGSLMLVWGGIDGTYTNKGARYDPISDSWTPTSTVGAPSGRSSPSAIWTGNLMVVWGGYDGYNTNTGGRYDPTADTWTPTSTVGAPSGRLVHSAVWTGSAMVVWGGIDVDYANTGGRYDPESDTWLATSTTSAPSARVDHTAIWAADTMIVWGGFDGRTTNSGGRYDPSTDSWTPVSSLYAPTLRGGHTAVWTGSLMVVWGGDDLGTGGQYDPVADRWIATSTVNAPSARAGHTAVWTGSSMIIWGGGWGRVVEGGGRWRLIQGQDTDGDGHVGCVDDCDDTNPRCVGDCSDADGDGYCTDLDCDDAIAVCTSDCSDSDSDGVPNCVANPTLFVTVPSDDGVGSLRAAVRLARDGDTIKFDPSLDQSPILLTSGEVSLDKSVTILGRGSTKTIIDGGWQRVLRILSGRSLIAGVTLRNGHVDDAEGGAGIFNQAELEITAAALEDNSDCCWGDKGGGGIRNQGTMVLTDVRMQSNSTNSGRGGAIYNEGVLTIRRGRFVGNYTPWGGVGVIYNAADGMLNMEDSEVTGGYSDFDTPGLRNDGVLTVARSLITGGVTTFPTSEGGALYNTGLASLVNCTISNNRAYLGGGLYNTGTLVLSDSTVTGNRTYSWSDYPGAGGGIYNTGALTIRNTIVAKQEVGSDCVLRGTVVSEGFNLDSDGTCGLVATTDHPATDPLLGPLAENGGLTFSHALLPGSPAIDSGSCPELAVDQRGLARPVDIALVPNVNDGCDIGAFEAQGPGACRDRDHDGFAYCDEACVSTGLACGDCNDDDAVVYPTAREVCDSLDNDCNGVVDDGVGPGTVTVTLEPDRLSPPNHRMADIHATVNVSGGCPSACPNPPVVQLSSVTSNEPDDASGAGDGDTVNDVQEAVPGSSDFEFKLRAERDGSRRGRLYQVAYTTTDCFGRTAVGGASVLVPHDDGIAGDPKVLRRSP